MKKSLVAVGVLAAVSAAQAQNVSVYGVMDAGYVSGKSGTVSLQGLTSGGHSTSRLGFRGSEDLGGGLRASFELEAGMAIDTGAVGGPTGATGGRVATVSGSIANSASSQAIFSRGAWVALGGGFGTIKAGKISLAANGFTNAVLPGSGNFDGITQRAGVFASGNQFATWRDNTVEYTSPAFNGVTVAVRYTPSNTSQTGSTAATGSEGSTAATKRYGQGTEVELQYSMGKLHVRAFDSKANLVDSATTEMTANGIGATYDFGFARAGLGIQKYDPSDAATGDRRKLTSLGISVPLSSALTLTANLGDLKVDASAAGTKYTGLGAHYALSKRTTAYAFYVKADNNATGAEAVNGFGAGNSQIIGTPSAGNDAQAMGVGVRHSF